MSKREESEALTIIEAACGLVEGESLPDAVKRYGTFRRFEMAHDLASLPGCLVCDEPPVLRVDVVWQLVCSAGCGVEIEGDLDAVMQKWAARPTDEELR